MLFHASIVALIAQYPVMQAISMCRDTASLATGTSVGSRSGTTIHVTRKSWWLAEDEDSGWLMRPWRSFFELCWLSVSRCCWHWGRTKVFRALGHVN